MIGWMNKAVNDHRLNMQDEYGTIDITTPPGMMLIPTAEYERLRQAFLELQQVVNPLFGLDRLQTGKQRRRDAK